MSKMIFGCSHGQDDVERATLPFIAANVAAISGQDAYVLLTVEGAWLATKGYADDMHFPGMPALRGLMEEFIDNGGTIWACGACTKPRDITPAHRHPRARKIGGAQVVGAIAAGAPHKKVG